jgi:hypothetical protein
MKSTPAIISPLLIGLLSIFTLSTAEAKSLTSIEGRWALTHAYCRAYRSGKLDKQSEAEASHSGLLAVDPNGNIEWEYVAQSCKAKKVQRSRDLFKIQADCEEHAVPFKESISIKVKGKRTIEMCFSNRKFPMYGHTEFTRCSSD